jgi:hypothetical protein
MTPDGRLQVSGTSGTHLIDTNGCFTDTAYNPLSKANTEIQPALPSAAMALVTAKSARTGAVYALGNNMLHPSLVKYIGKTLVASVPLGLSEQVTSMIVSEAGKITNIFVGFKGSGVRVYSDNGGSFKVLKTFATPYHDGPFVCERIAVDRTNEKVYFNGDNMITDWTNPVTQKLPVSLDDITVGPKGFIYGWNLQGQSNYANAFVKRYSGSTYAAASYGNTGNNNTSGEVYFEFGWAGTPGNHRGIGVGWQGQVAILPEASPLFQVPDTGGTGNVTAALQIQGNAKILVSIPNTSAYGDAGYASAREAFMGVRFDPAGNYYVGIRKLNKPIVPSGFGLDPAFRDIGAVVKFSKDSTGTFNSSNNALTGYDMIYPQPYGPFTQLATGTGVLCDAVCTCRSSNFDVDPYGRIYVPNGVTCQVYIADNAGNSIQVFGNYGNTDSRGGLSGPGQTIPAPAIPFAWPSSVGASEDFVYVTDLVNSRLVQVKMEYALDNIPGLTDHHLQLEKGELLRHFALSSAPVPFNPESRISVTLPIASNIDLKVYNVSGRLVRTLASGNCNMGVHYFIWNAKDDAGRNVSAGMYLYRLAAGKQVLMGRTLLAK